WNAATGQLILTKEDIPGNGLAISADGRLIARGQLRPVVWAAATGVELPSFKADAEWLRRLLAMSAITSLAFTPDGQRVVSGTYDCAVHVWDIKTGKELRRWVTPHWQIRQRDPRDEGGDTRAAVGGDGKRVIAAGWGQTAKIWDIDTGEEKYSLQGNGGYV